MLPDLTTDATEPSLTPHTPLTFARRAEPAELPELMDAPCPYPEFRSFLRDLDEVNRLTRAYTLTLNFLDRITTRIATLDPNTPSSRPERDPSTPSILSSRVKNSSRHPERSASARSRGIPEFSTDHPEAQPLRIPDAASSRPLRILDVGSGGGDTLRAIAYWAWKRNLPVELTGIDLNPHSTRAAQEFSTKDPLAANITFLTADIFTYAPDREPDIVLSALFTHHLSTPEIIRFLRWMEDHARLGWFINDLRRSRRAAFLFRFLPILFNWHSFIQYDGPVSLRRSFTPADWQRMLAQADVTASIEPHSLNRLCVARIRQLP